MNFLVIGLNHQTADLDLREKLAVPAEILPETLSDIKSALTPVSTEQVLVSTCNRTELYLYGEDVSLIFEKAKLWLSNYSNEEILTLKDHLYNYQNNEAIKHIFKVSSGLESMVLGEPQILGQVKSAVRIAQNSKNLGSNLNQLFQKAFSVAKDVRSNTEIGQQSISIASISILLVKQIFGNLNKLNILFIGAGEMIQLCLRHYYDQKPKSIVIANRNISKGKEIASNFNAKSISINGINNVLSEFDIVVSCTASALPIIGQGVVSTALKKRRNRPIVLIDLALPRDIESEVKKLDNVFVFTLDDLGNKIENNLKSRISSIDSAEKIIDENVSTFIKWRTNRENTPLIRAIKEKVEEIQKTEINYALKKISKGTKIDEVLKGMAKGILAKFLHKSFIELQTGSHEKNQEAEYWIKKIYDLESTDNNNEKKSNNKD